MAKSAFDRGTLTVSGSPFGVVDIRIGFNRPEMNVTDTETTDGASEFVAGDHEGHPISFKAYHIAKSPILARGTILTDTIWKCQDAGANYTTFTADMILFSAEVSGSMEGAMEVQYSGQLLTDFLEAQSA